MAKKGLIHAMQSNGLLPQVDSQTVMPLTMNLHLMAWGQRFGMGNMGEHPETPSIAKG